MSQSSNPKFNPDALHMSKAELLEKLGLIVQRWKSDPNIPRLLIKKYQADLILMRHFMSEADMPRFWNNFLALCDEIRSYNARKGDEILKKLNPLHEQAVIRNLLYVPGVLPVSALDAQTILAKARRSIYGELKMINR